MTAVVIDFPSIRKPALHQGALQAFQEEQKARRETQLSQTPERLSISAQNLRLRSARRKEWNAAARATRYWRASLDWCSALESGHMFNTGDAIAYGKPEPGRRFVLVRLWRVALVNQTLTPAPTMEAVEWKWRTWRSGQHQYVAINPETIAEAIRSDRLWLQAHPTRRPKAPTIDGAA